MSVRHRTLVALVLSLAIIGCAAPGAEEVPAGSDHLHITVSILPQAYFVEQVGGERVSVTVM
ncbi:MAG: metal ABC transporter solute-binding protein, Zn/Mn family, partial [Anaerolineae bacterium]